MHKLYTGPNVRASGYNIVRSQTHCLACDAVTGVFAISLAAGYESLNADESVSVDVRGVWQTVPRAAVLSFIESLPEAVSKKIAELTAHYRFEESKGAFGRLLTNHCEHCGARFEEEELHEDMHNPFGHVALVELKIPLETHEVREPFEAWAACEKHGVGSLDG